MLSTKAVDNSVDNANFLASLRDKVGAVKKWALAFRIPLNTVQFSRIAVANFFRLFLSQDKEPSWAASHSKAR
jgi:hypothetical protein